MRPLSFISYYSSFLNALGVIIGSSFIFCLVYYSLTQVEKVYVRVSPMSANSASFRSIPAIISAVSWAFANISSSSNHGTGLIGWCFALLCMLGFAYNGYLMITQVMKIMKEDVQDKDYALHFLCVVLFCFAVICMTMMWRCGSYEHNIGYSSTDRLIAMLFTFAVVLFSWPVKKIDDNEKLIPAETPETHEAHETPASDTDLVGVLFKE